MAYNINAPFASPTQQGNGLANLNPDFGSLWPDLTYPTAGGDRDRRDPRNTEPTRGMGMYDDPGFMGPPEPAPDYRREGPYPWNPPPGPPPPVPTPTPAPPPPPPPGRGIMGVAEDGPGRGGDRWTPPPRHPNAPPSLSDKLSILEAQQREAQLFKLINAMRKAQGSPPIPEGDDPTPPPSPWRGPRDPILNDTTGRGDGSSTGSIPPGTIPPGTDDVPDPRFPNPVRGGLGGLTLDFGSLWPDFGAPPTPTPRPSPPRPYPSPRPLPSPFPDPNEPRGDGEGSSWAAPGGPWAY